LGSCNAQREIRLNWRLMQAPGTSWTTSWRTSRASEGTEPLLALLARGGAIYPDYEGAKAELAAMSHHFMAL